MSLFRTSTDKNYEVLIAENSFVTDIQLAVEAAMHTQGVSQAELAKRIGITEARVSQILAGNGANLQARTIARIAYALGVTAVIQFMEKSARAKTSQCV